MLFPSVVHVRVALRVDSASHGIEAGELTRNSATRTWTTDGKSTASLQKTLAHVFQSLAPAYPQRSSNVQDARSSRHTDVGEVGEAINNLWGNSELHLQAALTAHHLVHQHGAVLAQHGRSAFMNLTLQLDESGVDRRCSAVRTRRLRLGRRRTTAMEAPSPTALTRRAWLRLARSAATDLQATDRIMTVLVRAVHDHPTHDLRGQRFLNLVRLAEHWLFQSTALDEEAKGLAPSGPGTPR